MFRSLVFIIILISSPAIFAKQTPASILVLGDSLSAAHGIDPKSGWVNLLSAKITQEKKPYQVINASISGDTTINGLKRLPALLNKYQPEIVIIELGANDGLRGLSLKVMRKNLEKIILLSQQTGAEILLAGMEIPPNYGKRYTQAFNKTYRDLSEQYKTQLIPFLLIGVGDKRELMQNDGLHPTQAAQVIIMNTVWRGIKVML